MSETITWVLELDSASFEAAVSDAKSSLDGMAGGFTSAGKKMAKYSAAATAGLAVVAKGFMEGEVAVKRFNTVFGDSAQEVEDWYKANEKYISLTEEEYKGLAAGVGDILKPMGFASEEVAKLTPEIVEQAQALADWTGDDVATTTDAITSAMLGQTKSLQKYGIKLDSTMVKERARMIAQESSVELTDKEAEALATKELIMESATDANNAYADSIENGGTSQKTFAVAMRDLRQAVENMGNALAPAIVPLIEGFAFLANAISNVPTPILAVIGAIMAVIAIAAPLLLFIGQMITAVSAIMGILPLLGTAFAVLTGPIGLVIAAIIGIITVFVLFKDEIIAGVKLAWEALKSFGSWLIEATMALSETLLNAIKSFGSWLIDSTMALSEAILNNLVTGFTTLWEFVKNLFTAWHDFWINWIQSVISFWSSFFSSVYEVASSGLSSVANVFKSIFTGIYDFVMGIIDSIVNGISSAFSFIGDLKDTASSAISSINPFANSAPLPSTDANINNQQTTTNNVSNSPTTIIANGKKVNSAWQQLQINNGLQPA